MRAIRYLRATVLLLLLLLAGCSSSYVGRGYRALDDNSPEAAKEHFQKALRQDPDDLRAHRGLGLACYNLGEYDEAERELKTVQQETPEDGVAALYLGLIAERRGNLKEAEHRYRAYSLFGKEDQIARKIEGRMLYLRNSVLRQQAKEAVAFEQSGAVADSSSDAVGVLPFVISSPGADSLKPLATGLAAAVMYDLSQVEGLQVVERLQLKYLLQELELQEQGLLDSASSLRVGAIAQAGRLVNGSLAQSTPAVIALQSGIVELADSAYEYNSAFNDQGELERLLDLQKQLSLALLDSLGVDLSSSEHQRFETRLTDSLSAFFDYSRGFEALDAGNYTDAYAYFARAATTDPGFADAVTQQHQTALILDAAGSVDQFESGVSVAAAEEADFKYSSEGLLGYDIFDQRTPPGGETIERKTRTGPGTVSVSGSVE